MMIIMLKKPKSVLLCDDENEVVSSSCRKREKSARDIEKEFPGQSSIFINNKCQLPEDRLPGTKILPLVDRRGGLQYTTSSQALSKVHSLQYALSCCSSFYSARLFLQALFTITFPKLWLQLKKENKVLTIFGPSSPPPLLLLPPG